MVITMEQLRLLEGSEKLLPLDDKHQILFDAVHLALYSPEHFTPEQVKKINSAGWSDAEIFDAVDHGAFLFRFSKVLKAHSKQD